MDMLGNEAGSMRSSGGVEDPCTAHWSGLTGHPGSWQSSTCSPAYSHQGTLRGRRHETGYWTGRNTD